MAVRDIVEIGHPVLARPAEEVKLADIGSAEVQGVIDDCIDTMRAAYGAGIAANQIGVPLRIFTVEVNQNPRYPYKPDIPLTVIINPYLHPLSDRRFDNYEGCLSVPGMRGKVRRNLEIVVSGYDRNGEHIELEVRGYSAGTFQHEADHLDGILFPHKLVDPRSLVSVASFKAYYEADFVELVNALVAEFGA